MNRPWKTTTGRGKSGRSGRRQRVRDRARRGLAILPSLLTLGNLVCGFYAIVHVGAVRWEGGMPIPPDAFQHAAIAILLAMIFDVLDGRVARITRTTSDFGGQLDSLADVVSFGVAPGVLVAMLHGMGRYEGAFPFWSKMAWVFGAVYACGTAVRLARFNTETTSHDEDAHLWFKGLPSPAAAGVVATLVLLHHYLLSERAGDRLAWIRPSGVLEATSHLILNALPFVALAAGYLMVSTFRYVHAANYFLRGRKPFDFLAGAIFAFALFALFPEPALALAFCGFAATGPIGAVWRLVRGGATGQPKHAVAPAPAGDGDPARSGGGPRTPSQQHPIPPLQTGWDEGGQAPVGDGGERRTA